jgi:osmotically-inducible protein OsmY
MKTDTQLQRDVLDELEWEPSIDAAGIGVTIHQGIVTLTGTVPTYGEKVRAEEAAERVQGVRAVANDIEVRLTHAGMRDDTAIARAVADALGAMTLVPAHRIKIAVSKGWVTLSGEVDWQYQRTSAESAIRYLAGVRGVINDILVRPHVSAGDVKARIESAFQRTARADAQHIRVDVHDGTVKLSGDVRSAAERREAERTAWSAPGVTRVANNIAIVWND